MILIAGRSRCADGSVSAALLGLALLLPGCGATLALAHPDHPETGASTARAGTPLESADEIWRPAPGTSWQWQLVGPVDTSLDVAMYDIDLFDTPADTIAELHDAGRTVICYFSAGTRERWRPDAARFPRQTRGRESDDWPGERWLDIRQIERLAPVIEARLDLAVEKGCDGVEPDNVDGYINETGFGLTADDQLVFNRYLADEAHRRGLSVGLKNSIALAEDLEPWFDWALSERCFELDECETLLPFVRAGKAVFGVEYTGDPRTFCPRANALDFDWLFKTRQLDSIRVACR